MSDSTTNFQGLLYEAILSLPDGDGYFGYYVYKTHVEYVDVDEWTGGSEPKYWSHQEFYNEHKDSEGGLEKAVIEFLMNNKFII